MNIGYLRTSPQSDVIYALDLIIDLSDKIEEKPAHWKWVIVSLHDAVEGMMVGALKGTSGVGAFIRRDRESWLNFLSSNGKPPKGRKLETFMDLYERVKNDSDWNKNPIMTNQETDFYIKLLNDLRNDLIHLKYDGWSIDMSGFHRLIHCSMSIIEKISISPHPGFLFSEKEDADLKNRIELIKKRFPIQ